MLQESLVLRMVGTVRTSVKVFSEKVASNLVLMILRAPPGRNWNGGEANGVI